MKKVVVALQGGLGNQMFQYAAGRAVALRSGVPVVQDLRLLLHQGKHAYGLGEFRLGAQPELITEGPPPWGKGYPRRLIHRLMGGTAYFREAGFPYDGRILRVKPAVRLEGYFQSERYFAAIADVIRADFTVRAEPEAEIDALAGRLLPAGRTISLHVRRGDYTTPQVLAVHGLMAADYYHRALRVALGHAGGGLTVCVFTDDPGWARAHLPLPAGTRFISEHTRSALHDLVLMSRCSHHITSNSSFSWWGAWLNPRPSKIVITPAQWFQPTSGLDTRDLRPAGWLRV